MSDVVTIAVIDDHPAVLHGVSTALRRQLGAAITTVTAPTVKDLLSTANPPRTARAEAPAIGIVLLDVQLNDYSEPAHNVEVLSSHGLPVLLYTQESNPVTISRCLQAGALGLVGKHEPLDVLSSAIERVLRGEPHLSQAWAAALEDGAEAPALAPREHEALRLYATGLPLKSVAKRMAISPDTVKEYLLRARRKYAEVGRPADTRIDLYIRAVEDGHIPAPGNVVRPE